MEKVLINESTEPTPKVTALLWFTEYYEPKKGFQETKLTQAVAK